MRQNRPHLFERHAGKPLDKRMHRRIILEVFEERRDRHARATKEPRAAVSRGVTLDRVAGIPVNHALNMPWADPARHPSRARRRASNATARLAKPPTRTYLRTTAPPTPPPRSPPVPPLPTASALLLLALSAALPLAPRPNRPPPDRRVVDTAIAGNAESEAAHGFVGQGDESGATDGKTWRRARGFMRFALRTFDDTEVTVAWVFAATDTVARRFDVVVEDSLIATRVFQARAGVSPVVEVAVPFAVTHGRTNIAVIIRAHGDVTPALREVRTVQDHNEVDFLQPAHSHPLQHLTGVAR